MAEFLFSKLMLNCIIWKNNVVALTVEGFNFDEFKLGHTEIIV